MSDVKGLKIFMNQMCYGRCLQFLTAARLYVTVLLGLCDVRVPVLYLRLIFQLDKQLL